MSPPAVPVSRASQNAVPNQYLVGLKEHSDVASHLNWLQQRIPKSDQSKVVYKYGLTKGYTAILTEPVLEAVTKRDDVKSIDEDRQPTW
ncbi:unnamed protein product [Rhizoctonia solani]|uniref:Inhibitor I9 domain-containing protein n=3 Tax=Rhizoctonia solani TaxID=456999 RepID=A0A8H3DGJ0_9AGAM|nr:peptidase inhibitor I9 [Rhizoctonia solani AG-3 Rhs1AP]KEP49512.1 peptidase inhibitor I9 [Rhizoctonia solani 123E]CAE6355916.1 unnamed protein product [Rhizoctonia solani]CAE6525006.1 unnamed protein product [Rhizoctonia solani]